MYTVYDVEKYQLVVKRHQSSLIKDFQNFGYYPPIPFAILFEMCPRRDDHFNLLSMTTPRNLISLNSMHRH